MNPADGEAEVTPSEKRLVTYHVYQYRPLDRTFRVFTSAEVALESTFHMAKYRLVADGTSPFDEIERIVGRER